MIKLVNQGTILGRRNRFFFLNALCLFFYLPVLLLAAKPIASEAALVDLQERKDE